jgi:hypothetical protein
MAGQAAAEPQAQQTTPNASPTPMATAGGAQPEAEHTTTVSPEMMHLMRFCLSMEERQPQRELPAGLLQHSQRIFEWANRPQALTADETDHFLFDLTQAHQEIIAELQHQRSENEQIHRSQHQLGNIIAGIQSRVDGT